MDSNELKGLIAEIKLGNLKKSIEFIKSSVYDLSKNNTIQLSLLITLSQSANKANIAQKIVVEDLKTLFHLCCTRINNPTEAEVINYYRSLYHIFRFLRNKISLREMTSLYSCIFSDFLNENSISSDISDLLCHFIHIIDKDSITPNLNSETSKDPGSLLTCMKYNMKLVKLCQISAKNPVLVYKKITFYANQFNKKKLFDKNQFIEFSDFIFKLLSESEAALKSTEASMEYYNAFVTIILIANYYGNDDQIYNKIIQKSFDKLKILNNDFQNCVSLFERFYSKLVRLALNKYSTNDITELKMLRNDFEDTKPNTVVIKTFGFLSEIIRSKVSFFDTIKRELWVVIKTAVVIEFIKIFDVISEVIRRDKYIHQCVKECTIEQNYNHAVTISSLGATFLNHSLRYEMSSENIEQLNDVSVISIKNCLKYISVMKTKGCNKWVTNWRMVGALIYNIATKFYQIENYRMARFYFKMLAANIVFFEGKKGTDYLIAENCLANTLHMLANCYSNIQRYREALTYLAYAVHISPEYQKAWTQWMNIKFKANSNDIGNISELTIKDILSSETDLETIRQIQPNFTISRNEIENLLFIELKSYNQYWASKIPIKNTAKQILEISNDPYVLTQTFYLSYEKTLSIQDESYTNVLQKTIATVSQKQDLKSQIFLSVLLYIEFQIKNYEVFKKNLSEMNENESKKVTPVLKPYEEQPNPNDRCEIIPTYFNNKIETNLIHFKILFKVMDLWLKIFESPDVYELVSIKTLIESLNFENLVKKAAYECRVQNYRYKMIEIWLLYYHLGKILNKNDIQLCAIGFILESIDFRTNLAKNFDREAQEILNRKAPKGNVGTTKGKEAAKGIDGATNVNEEGKLNGTSSDSSISVETETTFYINKSMGYYQNGCLTEGVIYLEKARSLLGYVDEASKYVLEGRILYLESLYLQKSCESKIIPHDKNFILLAHNSFAVLADFYKKKGSKCLYTLSVLLDISFMIGKMYKFLRMPREIRCYTSECVLLAQQIVLPLRTAQFFSLLAFADLLGHRFDDCQVKISGLDYILGYHNSTSKKNSFNAFEEEVAEVNKGFERLNLSSSGEIECMLDVPVEHRTKNLQGSPILKSKSFLLPLFIYHLDCQCFYCTNFDFLRLILEATHLQACFFMHQNNYQGALELFNGARRIYKGLLKKYDSKILMTDVLKVFKRDLNVTYSECLIDFSIFYAKQPNYDVALKTLGEIGDIMGDDLASETNLLMEVLYCRNNILSAIELLKENETEIKNKNVSSEMNSSETDSVDLSIYIVKTPENKVSTVKIDHVSPNNESFPKRRPNKGLKFDLSDNEITVKPKKETFKINVEKTPAPISSSKIKIFTPAAPKIKPLSMQISPKCKNDLKELPLIPERSTQNSTSRRNTKKLLNQKTQLLTQKLKSEFRKDNVKDSDTLKEVIPNSNIEFGDLKRVVEKNSEKVKNENSCKLNEPSKATVVLEKTGAIKKVVEKKNSEKSKNLLQKDVLKESNRLKEPSKIENGEALVDAPKKPSRVGRPKKIDPHSDTQINVCTKRESSRKLKENVKDKLVKDKEPKDSSSNRSVTKSSQCLKSDSQSNVSTRRRYKRIVSQGSVDSSS